VSALVLDASVVVKWVIADPAIEPHADRAMHVLDGIRSGHVTAIEPPHWLAEVAAVVCRLAPRRARDVVGLLQAMDLPVSDHPDLYGMACDLSVRLGTHLFDTLYHAVALSEPEATLVTADERYYRRASRTGHIVRLADVSLPAGS
jgi:predicted nucleic acid-binding protein